MAKNNSTAVIPVLSQPKIYTVVKPYRYNEVDYEIDYQFQNTKDENGYYQYITMKSYKFIEGKRIEIGGSWNNVLMHFVSNTLNTYAPRQIFESWLDEQIKKQNN